MIYKIKVALRNWSDKSNFGSMVFQFARKAVATLLLILPDEKYAQWLHKLYTGKKLDLKNPKYFDEKVWWLKLNNRDPLLTTCSDKHLVREYVKNCGYEDILIPQLGLYENAKEIPFEQYKEEVIIKCTSGSGENFIYSPSKNEDIKLITKRMNYALKQNPFLYSREWNYKNIENKITVEKLMRDKTGRLPENYRLMCFDGQPKLLLIDIGLIDENNIYNHGYPRNIYDMDFNLLPFKMTHDNYDGPIEKPKKLEKMIEIAKKLSEPFPFCRVDLYDVDGEIYFGEITFYHAGGCNNIQPEEWDLELGSWINIDNCKIVKK